MNNKESSQDFFCERVAEAYCYYLMKMNGDLVYHHMFGDIQINPHFIVGLLDGWSKARPKRNPEWWGIFLSKLLAFGPEHRDNVIFVGGITIRLNKRGIRYLNAFLNDFGMMLIDIGVPEGNGRYRLPNEEERKVHPWLA